MTSLSSRRTYRLFLLGWAGLSIFGCNALTRFNRVKAMKAEARGSRNLATLATMVRI